VTSAKSDIAHNEDKLSFPPDVAKKYAMQIERYMAKSGPFYVRKEHRQPKDGEEASTSKV
jgi:hypothetical protein